MMGRYFWFFGRAMVGWGEDSVLFCWWCLGCVLCSVGDGVVIFLKAKFRGASWMSFNRLKLLSTRLLSVSVFVYGG